MPKKLLKRLSIEIEIAIFTRLNVNQAISLIIVENQYTEFLSCYRFQIETKIRQKDVRFF
jgi:hypothetical protein